MGQDRFMSILKYLHLNDNTKYIARGEPNHNPLHKFQPLVDLLNEIQDPVYTVWQYNLWRGDDTILWKARL